MNILHLARLEFERPLSSRTVIACTLLLAAIIGRSYLCLDTIQYDLGGALDGTTAIDLFYIAINDTWCAIVLIPITSLVLCMSVFSSDAATGFDQLLLTKVADRKTLWLSKAIAVALRCATFVAILAITLAIVDQALYATPLPTSRVPEWLAYSGFTDEYLLPGLPTYSLVPETWNYTYFILCIWFVESIICTSVVLFYTGITIRSAFPALPVLVGFLGQFIVLQLPQLFADLTFLLDPAGAAERAGVPVRGVVVDALCLGTYAWGAGLFQTGVGGPALLARAANELPLDEMAPQQVQSLLRGYSVNSFATLIGVVVTLLIISIACIAKRYALRRTRKVQEHAAATERGTRP